MVLWAGPPRKGEEFGCIKTLGYGATSKPCPWALIQAAEVYSDLLLQAQVQAAPWGG